MRFQKQITNIFKLLLLTIGVAIPIFGYQLPFSRAAMPLPPGLETVETGEALPQQWLTPANTGEASPLALQATPVCTTPNVAIPDAAFAIPDPVPGVVTNTLIVDSTGTISSLNVYISATHTVVGDLVFILKHVNSGFTTTLINRPGYPGSACQGADIDAILADEAALLVEDECADSIPTISGIFKPNPNNPLSVFDGQDLSGTWQMIVSDNAWLDSGTLIQWCLQSDPDFAISKTRLSASPATVGESVDFQIVVTNTGGTALTTMPLTDTFNDKVLAFSSAISTPDTADAGQLLWNNIGPLAAGQSVTLTLQFTATDVAADATNLATASAIDVNGMPAIQKSDSATITINAGSVPDFVIAKTVISTRTVAVSQTIDFQITVTNTGNTHLTTIPLTDTFDTNALAYSSAISTPDTANAGQLLWDNIGPLAVGQGVTVTVRFTVTNITGSAVNTAAASALDANSVAVAAKIATTLLSNSQSVYLPVVIKNSGEG